MSLVAVLVLLSVLVADESEEERRELTITANFMRQHREKGRYELRGEVHIAGEGYSLRGDEGFIDESGEYIRVEGNAYMVMEDGDEELAAHSIIVYYERDILEAIGEAYYVTEDMEVWCEYLHHDGDMLTLRGNVTFAENGDWMKGEKFLYDLNENVLEAPEGVEISVGL